VPIKWESVDVTPRLKDGKTVIPDEAIDSVTKNYVALKGPLAVRRTTCLTSIASANVCRRLLARATSR
jgi:isocitrate dehydrogenase